MVMEKLNSCLLYSEFQANQIGGSDALCITSWDANFRIKDDVMVRLSRSLANVRFIAIMNLNAFTDATLSATTHRGLSKSPGLMALTRMPKEK